ncbi:drug resistance transporter, EmrB/QacA subfamily domain protein [Burkholderia pseudomallei MSHR3964]|nr:drug resistance transporter, EmrB/QacA subfamily domain protein [Burkholderia pseudomallei MSHR3964]
MTGVVRFVADHGAGDRAGVSLVSLLIWELGEAHPVVELSLFRERTFTFCVVIISLGMMSFSVVGVVFPLWLQAVMGYTAYQAGLATASMGLLALVFSILVGCMRAGWTHGCW